MGALLALAWVSAWLPAQAQWTTVDSFSDGNYSASPRWLHDTNRFTVSTSDAGPATPTPTTTNTLRLNGSGAATDSITVPNTNAALQQEWAWWWGRRGQAATAANPMRFWIHATETNLESATVDGYAVSFGDDAGGDDLFLQRVDNGVFSSILTSATTVANAITDFGFCVRVAWSNGTWKLFSSTLPTATGGGTNHLADPVAAATISQGSVSNGTYWPTNGYLGFQAVHSSGGSAIIATEVDQIMVSNLAVAAAGELNLSGGGLSIADGDTTPQTADGTDFGNVLLTAAVTNTFVFTNAGGASLTLSGVTTGGAHAADFVVVGNPIGTLAAGAATNLVLVFQPAAGGGRTGVVTLASDDTDEASYDFTVSGIGVAAAPEVAVLGTNGSLIADGDGTPSTADGTDFGSAVVAGVPVDRTLFVTNSGNAALALSGVSTSGAHAADFVVLSFPSIVSPGTRSNLMLRFVPQAGGGRTGQVVVATDDADEASYDFAVQGVGQTTATVTTAALGTVGETTAQAGGTLVDEGGLTVTNLGVVYNTAGNPTLADGVVATNLPAVGPFTSTVGGLTPGQTYFVRAFAQNAAGTSYGGVSNFAAACFAATVSGLHADPTNASSFTAVWNALSGATGYQLDVSTAQTFGVSGGGSGTIYTNTFEGASKGSYASNTLTIGGQTWWLADALIGTSASDRKNGSNSARLQNTGTLGLQSSTNMGLSAVTLLHATYGTDGSSAARVEYTTDGWSTWSTAGTFTASSTTLTAFEATNLNVSGSVAFRLIKTSGGGTA